MGSGLKNKDISLDVNKKEKETDQSACRSTVGAGTDPPAYSRHFMQQIEETQKERRKNNLHLSNAKADD